MFTFGEKRKKSEKTIDSVNGMFTKISKFNELSHNLLNARTFMEFEVWFDRLEAIDKRSLFLYIKEYKEDIPTEYLNSIYYRLKRAI